jgi:hypothetical protein
VRADRRGLVGDWTIAILIILGTGNTAFASAWHGVNRFEAAGISSTFPVQPPRTAKRGKVATRIIAHHIGVQRHSRLARDARRLRASPISIWPFSLPYVPHRDTHESNRRCDVGVSTQCVGTNNIRNALKLRLCSRVPGDS